MTVGKRKLSYLVLHVSKVCHPRCSWTERGRPRPPQCCRRLVDPSELSRKLAGSLAGSLASRINTQSAAFTGAVTPRTLLGLRVHRRDEGPAETAGY